MGVGTEDRSPDSSDEDAESSSTQESSSKGESAWKHLGDFWKSLVDIADGVSKIAAAVLVIISFAVGGSAYLFAQYRHSRSVPAVNLALNKHVTFSSNFGYNGWEAVHVTDGNISPSVGTDEDMGWASSGHSGPDATEWIEVDLATKEAISDVRLYPRNDSQDHGGGFPSDFTISISPNDKTWTTPVVYNGYPSPGTTPQNFFFPSRVVRYVKVTATVLNKDIDGIYYFELKQIEVFNH